jgi:hypothetical protein
LFKKFLDSHESYLISQRIQPRGRRGGRRFTSMIMIMVMFVGVLWRKTVDNSTTILYMGDDDDVVV